MQIVIIVSSHGFYKGFPSMNIRILFLRACRFFLFLCFIFIAHFFMGLPEPLWTPEVFSFCAFTCLSNNSLISWWISAKLGLALPPSILYLSYYFQPKENTWMCLWKVITLQVDFCHNLDPWQMIYITFQLHNLYWCIILYWKFWKSCRLEFFKTML